MRSAMKMYPKMDAPGTDFIRGVPSAKHLPTRTTVLLRFLCFLLAVALSPNVAEAKVEPHSPELIVHLLDYLAKDYAGAVQNGKVVSSTEYREQLEFAGIVKKTAQAQPALSADAGYSRRLAILIQSIETKGDAAIVASLARRLQQETIQLAKIEVSPTTFPSITEGRKLYEANCVACHGMSGGGDGPAGASLDPKPANFHDSNLAWNTAPYNFFNTIRLGVPGTGMASFANFSDQEVWALAFYLKALPHREAVSKNGSNANLSLRDLATLTDAEIAGRLHLSRAVAAQVIAGLRLHNAPAGPKPPLDLAIELVVASLNKAKKGDFTGAQNEALAAYLEGIEPLEAKIKANIPGAVEELEAAMSGYRNELKSGYSDALARQQEAILGNLRAIQARLSAAKMSPQVAFVAAFSIFLREGFEAILIIIVLISILKAMNQPQALIWIHGGWALAVCLGIAGWFASGLLLSISGMSRELMEGAISVLAVAVLLYVGFWLHRHSEMKRWHGFLKDKLQRGLGRRSYLGLALVSFLAVFREAIEVVLFLRAIWIDLDPSGQSIAGLGVLSSVCVLAGLAVIAVRQSGALPLGLLFRLCSWTMACLALILTGKGIHSLQEAGILPVSTARIVFRADLLGIYPTLQTIVAQAAVLLLIAAVCAVEKRRTLARVRK
jgi:high-affinity iron transporter